MVYTEIGEKYKVACNNGEDSYKEGITSPISHVHPPRHLRQ